MKTMRSSLSGAIAITLLLACVLLALLPTLASSRRINRTHSYGGHRHHQHAAPQPNPTLEATVATTIKPESYMRMRRPGSKPDTLQVAGSSLPDCSHACGSCFPCRLVMVSFVCSTLEEAETCPMAYKCMCRNKSFPVP